MTNPNYTALVLVVDRSGSMRSIAQTTQEALEEYLNGQDSLDGKLTVDTVFFDDKIEERAHLAPASTVDLALKPRGMTALYDAVGSKISSFGEVLSNLPEDERPERVLFVIATDGAENASQEYTGTQVADLIKQQQDTYAWKFVFIGANQDAVLAAKNLNISRENAITFAANASGTRNTVEALRGYTTTYRGVAKGAAVAFSDSDRAAAMDISTPVDALPTPAVKRTRKSPTKKS